MVSLPVSQPIQRAPSHTSQASGGWRGSTPTPSTRLSSRTTRMHRGTTAGRAKSMASPASGRGWKHGTSAPSASRAVRSDCSPVAWTVTSRSSSLGTIGRSSAVAKTTASSVSVRSVETSVPARSRTVSGCGAESQKSTSARAAAGGKSRMPSRSRKAA